MSKNYATVILLAFLLTACTSTTINPPLTASATPPTIQVRIAALTPTAAYKLGVTPKPTKTPQPSATRTPVATFTPATPAQVGGPTYKLREWTAEQADLMIDQILSHLKTSENDPKYASTYGYESYIMQYQYLATAEMEALLRFPDAPQAETWRWDICYNLALSYAYAADVHAPELACYAKLIDDGLNSGQTNIADLPGWFGTHESRFVFDMVSIAPPVGYDSRRVIRLEHSAFLLLLEKDGKFETTGLISSMFFFRDSSAKSSEVDLTGDQFPELILHFNTGYCCGFYSSDYVYDISSPSPKLLTFANLDGSHSYTFSEHDSTITPLNNEPIPGFVFKSHDGDPLILPCDLRQYEKYAWNNHQFELIETWYGIEPPDKYRDKDLCQFAIDTATNQDETNLIVHELRQVYNHTILGFRQMIPYKLGEYYAGLGNYEKAYRFFSDVAAVPSDESNKKWVHAAKTLLEHYKTANDFYQACAKVEQCDMRKALKQEIEKIQPALFPTVSETLQAIGITVQDRGVFDFNADGSAEQWLVIQQPGQNEREFWVLVKGSQKIDALFVTDISSATPVINRFEAPYDHPAIELKTPSGKILFSLHKLNLSAQPYISISEPPRNADDKNEQIATQNAGVNALWSGAVDDAATAMLTGTDPVTVKETLLKLKQSRNYDCKISSCDQLAYFLGLANELSGDAPAALETYLQLWQDYPDSIYTIMGRSKLEQAP